MVGVIGRKLGMTQVFDANGYVVPVTVIKVEKNTVVDVRTPERHGYRALVLGAFPLKASRAVKPYLGQFQKRGLEPKKVLREIRDFEGDYKPGDEIGVEIFEGVRFVDVRGLSKGKGYQGVMKRHGFSGGPASHGSKFHRAHGSTGQSAYPSKVLKGTKMAGRMGGVQVCVQNLRIVEVDKERGCLLVEGAVPGPRKGVVIVTRAKKKR
ncbi:50S ribosomal protein L3 [Spirochaeta thermophila]|uniref:Large ribosomal subunit protein uL3 n=1 Tax=Winmispira thermophila (strain ATCC 49972 / DSM 6192 / RI 19.B1) TaxID=665571 RepID=E0RQ81_WINT6|nr:50S ribosomal protein L3 [Spirochaeta thermophila]ADN01465.1 50S ribosomal protein L3 [Spirochaeta thermophila DSM 6192]